MATRTSTRHAAQKAKEAIASSPDVKRRGSIGEKRKGSTEKGPEPKRGKIEGQGEVESHEEVQELVPQDNVHASAKEIPKPEKTLEKPEEKPLQEADVDQAKTEERKPEAKAESRPEEAPDVKSEEETKAISGAEKSHEREDIVPSNVLEKGIIYFFYRPRVSVSEARSFEDVARSFFVLRPTPLGAALDQEQAAVDPGAKCRLLMLPKKRFPTSGREREMGFVEKAGKSMEEIRESFAGKTYETATMGTREVPEATPYAEGVYAITSTKRATHIVYILTIPEELGTVQEDFGLHARGSWLIQSKNPAFPGPPFAQLPQEPEYPESLRQKFRDLRWIPMEPELLDYPNAQFLMIGSASGTLGKAASAELGEKRPEEEQPGEEVVKMEDENEERIETLGGDHAIYTDLGYRAQKYPRVVTTWDQIKTEDAI